MQKKQQNKIFQSSKQSNRQEPNKKKEEVSLAKAVEQAQALLDELGEAKAQPSVAAQEPKSLASHEEQITDAISQLLNGLLKEKAVKKDKALRKKAKKLLAKLNALKAALLILQES